MQVTSSPCPITQERKGDNSEFKLIKPLPSGGGVGERSLNGDRNGLEEITFLSKFALHPN
jgi:hypothetical protein